jgi:AI-2 transport protein TqsA
MAEAPETQAGSKVGTACLLVVAFVAAGVALSLLRQVLVPFVLALFFAYSLGAVIDFQVRRLRMPRGVAILTTAVVGLAVLTLVTLVVVASVTEMARDINTYRDQVDAVVAWVTEHLPLEDLGIKRDPVTGNLFTISQANVPAAIAAVLDEVKSLVANGALVLVFLILLLVGGSKGLVVRRNSLLEEIAQRVRAYTFQMLLLSAVTGVLVGGVLAVLGIRFALVFGFLAFLLNFIPTIGAAVATLLPLPVVVLTPGLSTTTKVLAIALPAVIQALIGNLVQPKMLGRSFGLHPVAIVLALIFFGTIWGVVGAFLATPITAVIKVLLERIPETRFVAAPLAGTYGEEAVSGGAEAPKA